MSLSQQNPDKEYLFKLRRFNKLKRDYALFFYRPHPKQLEFHGNGEKRERMLMAGNQLGKTFAAGCEVAFHLTGLYPGWWNGRVIDRANRGWVGSVKAETVKDGAQRILLGPPNAIGTGVIPKDRIHDLKRARGVPDCYDSVFIKHTSGDISQLVFKSYQEGREAWQAETLDWIWYDEEPPIDIYTEGLTRTNNTGGFVFLTFTPLKGMSDLVLRFIEKDDPERPVTHMTIDDALHIGEKQKEDIIRGYLPHEREARAKGIPMMGSGKVFPILEEQIQEPPIIIDDQYLQIIGIDFGWGHPTAAVRLCYDKKNDTVHVVSAYRQKEQTPVVHAAAIRVWGDWIPVAWPKDGHDHDKGSGESLAHIYRKQGIKMLHEHAQFPDKRGRSKTAIITEIWQRMLTGRFKVDANLHEWWEEFRMYHLKDGEIVKVKDDLMDATQHAVMMLRYAKAMGLEDLPRDKYSRGRMYDEPTWMGV